MANLGKQVDVLGPVEFAWGGLMRIDANLGWF